MCASVSPGHLPDTMFTTSFILAAACLARGLVHELAMGLCISLSPSVTRPVPCLSVSLSLFLCLADCLCRPSVPLSVPMPACPCACACACACAGPFHSPSCPHPTCLAHSLFARRKLLTTGRRVAISAVDKVKMRCNPNHRRTGADRAKEERHFAHRLHHVGGIVE